ncbi:MAG: TylF/MycF/NovP-related O-methyltransferase [Elstera sp.]
MTLADRYLALLKKALLNELYPELEGILHYLLLCERAGQAADGAVIRDIARYRPDIMAHLQSVRREGNMVIWPEAGSPHGYDPRHVSQHTHTMIGRYRLDHLHQCLDVLHAEGIPGDLIETGVWRGGATVFMRGYCAAHGITDRRIWVADSFAGLPPPSVMEDNGYDLSPAQEPALAIDQARVEALFARYDLLDEQVRFLPGWFRDTLPSAPIERLALLRLDGDLYESTFDALDALYDKVVPGGFIVVDDYGALPPCRQAIEDFRAQRAIHAPLTLIDWTGCAWRKPV